MAKDYDKGKAGKKPSKALQKYNKDVASGKKAAKPDDGYRDPF